MSQRGACKRTNSMCPPGQMHVNPGLLSGALGRLFRHEMLPGVGREILLPDFGPPETFFGRIYPHLVESAHFPTLGKRCHTRPSKSRKAGLRSPRQTAPGARCLFIFTVQYFCRTRFKVFRTFPRDIFWSQQVPLTLIRPYGARSGTDLPGLDQSPL